jgi:uncharacterized repeat protein (TIGR03803 family)
MSVFCSSPPKTQARGSRSIKKLAQNYSIVVSIRKVESGEEMNTVNFTLRKLVGRSRFCAVFLFCTAITLASPAQTYTRFFNFDDSNGRQPGLLLQGFDGNLYGTTDGSETFATIYKLTTAGSLATLYTFCPGSTCNAGGTSGPLLQAATGAFYGGASSSTGGFFRMTPQGSFSFIADTGETSGPSNLIEDGAGDFYGTTYFGGAYNAGAVVKVTQAGVLTTLYSFCTQKPLCPDGTAPNSGVLEGPDGNLYGTTVGGGAYGDGTLFRLTPKGDFTLLHSFNNLVDGSAPFGLMLGGDGNLYGLTSSGGANNATCFALGAEDGCGSLFKSTLAGEFTLFYSFCAQSNCADGFTPGELAQGTDGNLYGVTEQGGKYPCASGGLATGCGTIFNITPTGTLTTLHNFNRRDGDGNEPLGLIQHTDGSFYGDAFYGGSSGYGMIFRLSMGLSPFAKLVRSFGKAGDCIILLGQGFEGTTGVFVNGSSASFTVDSATHIHAYVPDGATSGYVTVETPSGTLTSNVVFQVESSTLN